MAICKRILCSLPFIFCIGFIIFIPYSYFNNYILNNYLHEYYFNAYFFSLSLILCAVLSATSVIQCCIQDPGYVMNSIYSIPIQHNQVYLMVTDGEERESARQDLRLQIHKQYQKQTTNQYNCQELLVYAKEPLLSNDIEANYQQPLIQVKVSKAIDKSDKREQEHLDSSPKRIRDFAIFRYCEKCKQVKPPRSHHCSFCNICILRMDHHCPWVGNCVGLKNHKFFWNFLLYTFIGCLQIALTIIFDPTNQNYQEFFIKLQEQHLYMCSFIMSLAFSFSVGGLFCFHTYMILNNLSTIEIEILQRKNIYNMGYKQNWKQVFGDGWYTWFLPIKPRNQINGIVYPERPIKKRKRSNFTNSI